MSELLVAKNGAGEKLSRGDRMSAEFQEDNDRFDHLLQSARRLTTDERLRLAHEILVESAEAWVLQNEEHERIAKASPGNGNRRGANCSLGDFAQSDEVEMKNAIQIVIEEKEYGFGI